MEVKIYFGRGGWSWYTGSASWYYRCGIKNILGINLNRNILTLNPCVPDDWDQYSFRYKYSNSIYNIKVINKFKSNKVKEIKINGEVQEDRKIILIDSNKIYDVEIII